MSFDVTIQGMKVKTGKIKGSFNFNLTPMEIKKYFPFLEKEIAKELDCKSMDEVQTRFNRFIGGDLK